MCFTAKMLINTLLATLCLGIVCSQSFVSRMEAEVDNYCELTTKIRIQLFFIFDRTYTFFSRHKIFAVIGQKLVDRLSAKYPGSEFSLAIFADYDARVGLTDIQTSGREEPPSPAPSESPYAGPGDCYTLVHKFTDPAWKFSGRFNEITQRTGAFHNQWAESTLTAVTFAAADKTVGWEKNYKDINGYVVRKVIVLATDATSTRVLKNNTGRHEVRGDGTDTCENTLPPTDLIVERVLKENAAGVVGLFYTVDDIKNYNVSLLDYYDGIFGRMDIPYTRYTIQNFEDTDTIVAQIISGAESTVKCDEDDPPPYNTLGL